MLGQETTLPQHSITVDRSTPARPEPGPGTILRDHGAGLKPEDQKLWDAALKKWKAPPPAGNLYMVAQIRIGKLPFYVFKQDGKRWGRFYDERTKTFSIKPAPLGKSLWDLIEDGAKGLLDFGCKIVNNQYTRTAQQHTSFDPSTDAQIDVAMSTAQTVCGGRGPSAGARVDLPKIAYYHKTQKLWHIYAPAQGGGLGFVGPAGYVFLATAATKPADAQDGGVIDDPIYKKWWFWAGLGGAAAATTGGVIWYKRRRRG